MGFGLLMQAMFSEGNLPGDAEFWRFNKIHEYGAYGEVNAHRYPSRLFDMTTACLDVLSWQARGVC
jgi:hypothetical protein